MTTEASDPMSAAETDTVRRMHLGWCEHGVPRGEGVVDCREPAVSRWIFGSAKSLAACEKHDAEIQESFEDADIAWQDEATP